MLGKPYSEFEHRSASVK